MIDGSRYKGDWKNDLQHGYGEENFPDGSRYEGNYVEGEKVGFGRFTWSDQSFYEGSFEKNSVISGKGLYQWKEGKYFKGDWRNNKMHGTGIFQWKDGKQFIGEYKFDKKEGYGRYIWKPDRYFEGFWKDGKQHGNGFIVDKDKIEYSHWRFGKNTRNLETDEIEKFKENEYIKGDLIRKIELNFKDMEPKPSNTKELITMIPSDNSNKLTVPNDIKIQYQSKSLRSGLGDRPTPRIS